MLMIVCSEIEIEMKFPLLQNSLQLVQLAACMHHLFKPTKVTEILNKI